MKKIIIFSTILFSLFIIHNSASAEITSGLVGHWKFDETSGTTAADSSANGNSGALTNGPTWTAGKINNALSFDGTNDYVSMGDPTNGSLDFATGDFSLSAWVYTPVKDTSSATHLISGKWSYSTTEGGYGLATRSGKYTLQMGDASGSGVCYSALWYGSNNSQSDLAAGVWEHVVVTFDRQGFVRLYVNGAQSYSKDISAASACNLSNSHFFAAGARTKSGSQDSFYNGSIDEVRVYNRVLTASDVLELYSYPITPGPKTYYVSTTGNDSNPGTQSQPWKTIQKAADTMVAGDTVLVNAGNYGGDVNVFKKVRITRSGSPGLPITFQVQGTVLTQGFLITADYITIKGFDVEDPHDARIINSTTPDYRGGTGIFVEGSYNIIEDNYIHGCVWGGIILSKSGNFLVPSNSIVRNNRIFRNGMQGISVSGRNNLIEGNEIWATIQHHPGNILNATATWLDADGMRFFGQGHIIRKNYTHDIAFGLPGVNLDPNDPNNIYNMLNDYNDNPHIDCFQTWGSTDVEAASNVVFEQNHCNMLVSQAPNENGHGFMLDGGTNNLTIKNNIIKAYGGINTGGTGGADYLYIYNNIWINNLAFKSFWPFAIGIGSGRHAVIKNNIFYDQPYHTVDVIGDTSNTDLDYNLAYNSDGSNPECVNWGNYDTCQPANHNLWSINPKFVNPSGNDYHLQSISPAINAGVTISSVTIDYDGNSRPQGAGYDIGAYEYVGVLPPDTTPPAAPTGVAVN